jgi:hypothetical protein
MWYSSPPPLLVTDFMYRRPKLCTVLYTALLISEEIHYVPIGDGWKEVHYVPIGDGWEELLVRNVRWRYWSSKKDDIPLLPRALKSLSAIPSM